MLFSRSLFFSQFSNKIFWLKKKAARQSLILKGKLL